MYYDVGSYDMKYDELKEICHQALSEIFSDLCIDMTKNKNEGKYCFCNESKYTYKECTPKNELFLLK